MTLLCDVDRDVDSPALLQTREQTSQYQSILMASRGVNGRSDLGNFVKSLTLDKSLASSSPSLRMHTFSPPGIADDASASIVSTASAQFFAFVFLFAYRLHARRSAHCRSSPFASPRRVYTSPRISSGNMRNPDIFFLSAGQHLCNNEHEEIASGRDEVSFTRPRLSSCRER